MNNIKFIVLAITVIALFALSNYSKHSNVYVNADTNGITLNLKTNAPSYQDNSVSFQGK